MLYDSFRFEESIDDAWVNLAIAIVVKAATDYARAKYLYESENRKNCMVVLQETERFLKDGYAELYNPKHLMERLDNMSIDDLCQMFPTPRDKMRILELYGTV